MLWLYNSIGKYYFNAINSTMRASRIDIVGYIYGGATLSRGKTFGATEEVTAAKLHALVDSATITGILTADISNSQITNALINDVSGAKFTSLANVPAGAGQIPAANLTNAASPAGTILMYGGSSAPTGWLACDGSAVSRTTYATLYGVVGTTYGVGNGSTTFNLPNFTSKMPRGNTAGTGAGSDTHTHTGPSHTHAAGTLAGPSHTHSVPRDGWGSATAYTSGRIDVDNGGGGGGVSWASGNNTSGAGGTGSVTGSTAAEGTGNTGSGSTLPAYTAVMFIIRT